MGVKRIVNGTSDECMDSVSSAAKESGLFALEQFVDPCRGLGEASRALVNVFCNKCSIMSDWPLLHVDMFKYNWEENDRENVMKSSEKTFPENGQF